MKLFLVALAIGASLCLVASSLAGVNYHKVFNEGIQSLFKNPEIIKVWKDGVKEGMGVEMDHLIVGYSPDQQAPYDDTSVVVTATLTIKIYGFKEDKKVVVIVQRQVGGLLDKETGKILNSVVLAQDKPIVKQGWDAIDV